MANNFISIRNNFPAVQAELKKLSAGIGDKVMVRALNTTIAQGKIEMARKISQEFRIKVGDAKDRLSVTRASAKGGALSFQATLEATQKGKGRSMNLIAFAERVTTLAQARKRMKAGEGGSHTLRNGGVVTKALELRFQIKRAGGSKVIQGAFLGNKGRTVFIRTGKDRFPIKALSTIDIPQMFNTKTLNAAVRSTILDRFESNFDREMRVIIGGFAK